MKFRFLSSDCSKLAFPPVATVSEDLRDRRFVHIFLERRMRRVAETPVVVPLRKIVLRPVEEFIATDTDRQIPLNGIDVVEDLSSRRRHPVGDGSPYVQAVNPSQVPEVTTWAGIFLYRMS